VGVLFDPSSGRSLLAGAITARDYLSQVIIDAPGRSIDARCAGDGAAVEPGEICWSEWFALDLVGRPTEQLERYGDALGRMMGARVPATAPAGWCSWYYFYTQVTEEDVIRNLRFLEKQRRELPVQTVQIDDGYQADIGDWLTVNEKFPHGMRWLASEIKGAGFTPGIWVAPFLLSESSATFAAHPEWVTRDAVGEPVVANNNWQRANYGMDGTHPGARAWIGDLFREISDGWGYDYLKIDFLFGAALEGRRYDSRATRAQAYRAALDAVREGAGDGRFILGCGSLMAPSVGYFDGNRIGPDVAPYWRFLTRAEREAPRPRARRPEDPLSAETAIRNTFTRWWTHGRLWANDPDCVLVRSDRTRLSLDETRSLVTAIGLSGGMVLSSDDLDRVPPERMDLLSMLLPALPGSCRPVDVMERDMPERVEVAFSGAAEEVRLLGLFNFEDVTRDLRAALPPGRWRAFERWDERYLGEVEGHVEFALVPPHGCRLVAIRPASGRPGVVGTTGHIGCGVSDITDERFDDGRAALVVALSAAGVRRRRVYVDAAGRAVLAPHLDGRPQPTIVAGKATGIDVEVDERAELVVTFGT
jgi:alpha-galactosidase